MQSIYSILTSYRALTVYYPHALLSYAVQCYGFKCADKDYCIIQSMEFLDWVYRKPNPGLKLTGCAHNLPLNRKIKSWNNRKQLEMQQ